VVSGASKKLTETVKWGNACWTLDDLPIVYLYGAKDHVQLGFFAGALLKDRKGLLKGKGKFVRFAEVESHKDIQTAYFTRLIKAAMKINYR
jgi:uncharacterized protein YdeI (YjbR/CyaY-like superfamily)